MSSEQEISSVWRFGRPILVLMAVCLFSGGGLGAMYWMSKKQLDRNERKVFNKTLQQAMGDFEERFAVGDYPDDAENADKVFGARTGEGIVYAATGAAQGYQSTVRVIVAVRAGAAKSALPDNPEILRLVALPTGETPGMGEKIHKVEKTTSLWAALMGKEGDAKERRPSFQKQFTGVTLEQLPGKDESMGRDQPVQPITGATVTSRAVVRAARDALGKLIERTGEVYGGQSGGADGTGS